MSNFKIPISFDQKLDFPYLNFCLLYVLFILLHNVEFIDFDIYLRDVKFKESQGPLVQLPLHKKLSFPFRISSVDMTKSSVSCGFGHIY